MYEKYLCYQTYDVTGLLKEGENTLELYVGDGWYCGPKTQPAGPDRRPVHAVLFQLRLEYKSGAAETICSDKQVQASQGPVRSSDLFAGELYDARKKPVSKKPVKQKDYGYEALRAQVGEPILPILTLPVQKKYLSPRGETILDFGQIMAGRVRMDLELPWGTKVILDHFEATDREGNYFNSFERGMGKHCDQRDVYISDGTRQTYEPYFTYHGFRYVRVQLIPPQTGESQTLPEIDPKAFTAVVLSTAMKETGTFWCADPRLNRLYENTRWSQRSNMVSIPTDCPQREKAGWTGDIMIYAASSLQNEDTNLFLERWLENLALDQDKNGAVPVVVPYTGIYPPLARILGLLSGNRGIPASAGWGDVAVLVPWAMYELTGNRTVLEQQYTSMKRWCGYIIHNARHRRNRKLGLPKEVDQYLWNTGFHFGEWLIPSLSEKGYGRETWKSLFASRCYTAPIFGYYSVKTMAKIAGILGQEEDCTYYQTIAGHMKEAFCKGILTPDGQMPIRLMGAYVLPLYFDLVPKKWQEQFAQTLVQMIDQNGGCLDTGFLAPPFLLDTLCKIGRQDKAWQLLFQTKAPSWLFAVEHGATSIWESWHAFDSQGNPFSMSLNHYSFGCVDDWIFRKIGGIQPLAPGFSQIRIAITPDIPLTAARRTFESPYGRIVSDWRREGRTFFLHAAIPCNVQAIIELPDGQRFTVGSGTYDFTCTISEA